MKLRKATLKDLKTIDEIYAEGSIDEGKLQFPKVSKDKMTKDLNKHKKNRLKGFRKDMLSKKNYWVLYWDNNTIMGFGNAEIKDYTSDRKYGEITRIYVRKNFRKKGIGEKIEEELIRWLKKKGIKDVGAGIYIKNKPSINLHKKLGFRIKAVRMEKKIK